MLLSQSQVSVLLSTTAIISFTAALFLAGYTVQQRTVSDLRSALRPHLNSPYSVSSSNNILNNPNHFPGFPGSPDANQLHIQRAGLFHPDPDSTTNASPNFQHQTQHAQKKDKKTSWWPFSSTSNNSPPATSSPEIPLVQLAYLQLALTHSSMCHALILFHDLHRAGSPLPRVLVFPRRWLRDRDGEPADLEMEETVRMLRKAARRYRVVLMPVGPPPRSTEPVRGQERGEGKGGGERRRGRGAEEVREDVDEADEVNYPLLETLAQVKGGWTHRMTLPMPSLVLNADALDAQLVESWVADQDRVAPLSNPPPPPSLHAAPDSSNVILTHSLDSRSAMLDGTAASSVPLASAPPSLTRTLAQIRLSPGPFNATSFRQHTALLHVLDADLAPHGADWDVPYARVVELRPAGPPARPGGHAPAAAEDGLEGDDEDPRWEYEGKGAEGRAFVWEKMWAEWRGRRSAVCGLEGRKWVGD